MCVRSCVCACVVWRWIILRKDETIPVHLSIVRYVSLNATMKLRVCACVWDYLTSIALSVDDVRRFIYDYTRQKTGQYHVIQSIFLKRWWPWNPNIVIIRLTLSIEFRRTQLRTKSIEKQETIRIRFREMYFRPKKVRIKYVYMEAFGGW